MIKQLKLFIIYKLSLYQYYASARKYIGGNWEHWYIDCIHSDLWFQVKKDLIKDGDYRPGCGRGTPDCEYYDYDYFGSRLYFDYNKQLRIIKIKNIIDDE